MSYKLWQTSGRPGERRLPVRVNRHGRFVAGLTVTIVGTRWSRTWGLLPNGTQLDVLGHPDWLGGQLWRTPNSRGAVRLRPRQVLTRPTLALCKWRYR